MLQVCPNCRSFDVERTVEDSGGDGDAVAVCRSDSVGVSMSDRGGWTSVLDRKSGQTNAFLSIRRRRSGSRPSSR
jgi:hypothetical protein